MDLKFRGKIGTLMKGVRVCDRNPRREIWGGIGKRERKPTVESEERERVGGDEGNYHIKSYIATWLPR